MVRVTQASGLSGLGRWRSRQLQPSPGRCPRRPRGCTLRQRDRMAIRRATARSVDDRTPGPPPRVECSTDRLGARDQAPCVVRCGCRNRSVAHPGRRQGMNDCDSRRASMSPSVQGDGKRQKLFSPDWSPAASSVAPGALLVAVRRALRHLGAGGQHAGPPSACATAASASPTVRLAREATAPTQGAVSRSPSFCQRGPARRQPE